MKRTRNSLNDEHRSYLLRSARSRKNIDFTDIAKRMNDKFGTYFSVYVVAAFLGNHGYAQSLD